MFGPGLSRHHPHHHHGNHSIEWNEICLWEMSRNLTFTHSQTRNEYERSAFGIDSRGTEGGRGRTWDRFPQPYECLMVRWLSHAVALSPTFLRPLFIVQNYFFSLFLFATRPLCHSLHSPLYSHPLYMKSDYSRISEFALLHGVSYLPSSLTISMCVCVCARACRWPLIITHSKHNYGHFFLIVISLSINVHL